MKKGKKISSAGIVVLSLFDGMSCGQIALQRAKIPVKTYYACEINKYAITVTQYNFPKTIQLGDVRNIKAKDLPEIPDLFIGGSPCQGFSNAGTGLNFDHPESKLFFEYIRLRNELLELNPNLKFLLENVPMKKEWENIITRYMGINHVKINSALVSAQNRKRLYWNNFNIQKYGLFDHEHNVIKQPKDKKIFLKDILDNEVDEKYFLSDAMIKRILRKQYSDPRVDPDKTGTLNAKNNSGQFSIDNGTTLITCENQKGVYVSGTHKNHKFAKTKKAPTIQSRSNCPQKGGSIFVETDIIVHNTQPRSGDPKILQLPRGNNKGGERAKNGKSPSISANSWKHNNLLAPQSKRIYNTDKKSTTLNSGGGGQGAKTGLYTVNSRIRRLTPDECARLQTVDPQYFKDENGKYIVSESRIYEMLGNGWTVDVVAHQLNYLKQNFNL